MKIEVYKQWITNEIVYKEDAQEYALDQLGIKIEPKGRNGEYTKEQYECLFAITEWYFSGDWIEDYIEEDEGNIFELIKEENEYNDKLFE